jgi:hypothetical protein
VALADHVLVVEHGEISLDPRIDLLRPRERSTVQMRVPSVNLR